MSGLSSLGVIALCLLGSVVAARIYFVYKAIKGNSMEKWTAETVLKRWFTNKFIIYWDIGFMISNIIFLLKDTNFENALILSAWVFLVWADYFAYSYKKRNLK